MRRRMGEWTEKDDATLAEIVLKHIREGSTQLNAFGEAADILERTAGACDFRWNGSLRHSYINAINHAKKQSRELKKNKGKMMIHQPTKEERSKQAEELLYALNDVYQHTENVQVKYIIGHAIEFIKKA